MNAVNNVTNVPADVFLAPLAAMRAERRTIHADLVKRSVELQEQLRITLANHKALPTMARRIHMFEVEQFLHTIIGQLDDLRPVLVSLTEDLQKSAQDALKLDPRYREAALQLVFETEQLARSSIKTVDELLDYIDLTTTTMLNQN